MKTYFFLFCFAITMLSCAQDKQPILGETEWQKEMNAEYKDASTSPLKEKDRSSFKSLDFFKFDSTYVVTATLKRTPNQEPFTMKTTTDRLPYYVKFGELSFNIKGETFKLNVYQNVDAAKEEDYDGHLFLPFTDDTNGDESYGGGRYISVYVPEGDTIEIDFNKAYNPYCAYNTRYSCPIVPRENYLDTKIEAGVKKFHD